MFLISKLLAFFIAPIHIIFILLALAYFLKSRRKLLLHTTFFLFLLFSQPLLFRGVIKWWEKQPVVLPTNDSTLQYVVVLGGLASHHKESNRIKFWQSGDRLFQALWVVNQNPIKQLIISGGSATPLYTERPEAGFLFDYLVQVGLDSSFITVDSVSRNTFENALYTSQMFEEKGWEKQIALVTSSWHMPRAKWCFEKMGFKVQAIGADFMYPVQPIVFYDYFLPSMQVMLQWQLLIKEWVGWFVYQVRYI